MVDFSEEPTIQPSFVTYTLERGYPERVYLTQEDIDRPYLGKPRNFRCTSLMTWPECPEYVRADFLTAIENREQAQTKIIQEMKAELTQTRRKALEEAAEAARSKGSWVCDENDPHPFDDFARGIDKGHDLSEDAIRALIEKEAKN